MLMYPRLFPRHRLDDPFRQAERRIFKALETWGGGGGFACYEWQRNKRSLQLDFALWMPGIGRFGLQIKGGHYIFSGGEWYRRKGRKGPFYQGQRVPPVKGGSRGPPVLLGHPSRGGPLHGHAAVGGLHRGAQSIHQGGLAEQQPDPQRIIWRSDHSSHI